MSRFRLEWARKCGERKAREHGFTSFPIDPFMIAANEDIYVEAKKPEQAGVSGGIIFEDNGVGIFYATNITSSGFQRFTIGHELGHYFLDGHPDEIMKHAPMHISRAGFAEGSSSIEIEADHFASGLLMPTGLVRQALDRNQIGLVGVERLALAADCSLTASAIRAAECSPYPMAVVVSRGERVCYSFLSEGFKQLNPRNYPRKHDLLPESGTRVFNSDPENIAQRRRSTTETTLCEWFNGPAGTTLDEEIIGLGSSGLTLTVFSSDDLPAEPNETEDDEAELIESYKLRFAYGR